MKSKFQRRVVVREGSYVAVFRPDAPLNSLNAAKRALNTQDYAEIERVADTEPLTFVGWLARDEELIDVEGNTCGEMKAGDHFFGFGTAEDVQKSIEHYNQMRQQARVPT